MSHPAVVRLWKLYGYRPFQDEWTESEPVHKGAEDSAEYVALPASVWAKVEAALVASEGWLSQDEATDALSYPLREVRAARAALGEVKP